jgi:hypothetical protein
MTIFYCLRFEIPATWRARSPYLYSPGRGRPSYNPRHWVPFSSPPTTHCKYLSSLCNPGTDRTENVSSIIACSLVAGEATCPQSCSLATAVILSSIYTAVTWQWVYMSLYMFYLVRLSLHRTKSVELLGDKLAGKYMVGRGRAQLQVLSQYYLE